MAKALLDRMAPTLPQSLLARAGIVLAGTALLALSAKVQVPFWPVPMTLQTLAVMTIGALFGARMAGATVLAYLVEGAAGLPVFATGGGLAYMAGPTGGYLFGFLLAATFAGWASDRGFTRGPVSALGVFLVAEVLIFGPGVLWLSGFTGADKALAAGLLPFLPGEALKLGLAALIVPALWRRARG